MMLWLPWHGLRQDINQHYLKHTKQQDTGMGAIPYERPKPIAPRLILWGLCLALGLGLARISWSIYILWLFEPKPPPAIMLQQSHKLSVSSLADKLVNANLFGIEIHQPITTALEIIPPSPLDIVIKGLLTSSGANPNVAILSINDQAEQVFQTGDTITHNSQLQQILPNGVLISQQGALTMVALPRAKLEQFMVPEQATDLQQLWTQVIQDPSQLKQYVRLQPVMHQGRFQGYQVQPGPDATWFKQVGLQPRDVILSVNGTQIASLSSQMGVMKNIQQASHIILGIQRHGQEQQLKMEFNP
jgi:type II secretion system protein C